MEDTLSGATPEKKKGKAEENLIGESIKLSNNKHKFLLLFFFGNFLIVGKKVKFNKPEMGIV